MGQAPDAGEIAARVTAKRYRAVVVIHNESATGVVADLKAIGAVLRDSETLLVVNSVSGVGGVEMCMDEWGVDVLVTASQKSLMCPPGLAVVAVSEKAMRVVQAAQGIPRFFLDFRRAKASLDKNETPFTPPVSLILGLREALAMIDEEGLAAVLRRHAHLSAALRAGFAALGFPMFPAGNFSPTVTVGRCARRPRRIDHRAPHVRELQHGHRKPAHQARQPRHPHRHDGVCRRPRTSSPTCTISNARCATLGARRRPARACRRPPRRLPNRLARRSLSYSIVCIRFGPGGALARMETPCLDE